MVYELTEYLLASSCKFHLNIPHVSDRVSKCAHSHRFLLKLSRLFYVYRAN